MRFHDIEEDNFKPILHRADKFDFGAVVLNDTVIEYLLQLVNKFQNLIQIITLSKKFNEKTASNSSWYV